MDFRKSRLLVVVENPDLGGILQLALREYDLDLHAQAGAAHDAFRRLRFDLAIVDLSLRGHPFDSAQGRPFGSAQGGPAGLDLIRDWRAAGGDLPIIALSDLPQASLAVESFAAGADDFLRKPFHHDELLARIRKLLSRRASVIPLRKAGGVVVGSAPFEFGGATVTPDLLVRFPDGAEERIRPKQHGILRMFAGRAGGLVLKEELVQAVWGSDAGNAGHSVNEYVSTLRRMFLRHRVDFHRLVTSEPKAGWRIHARAARADQAPAA